MKSGLEGRNNALCGGHSPATTSCLNEVRPRRPEQSELAKGVYDKVYFVSMKSGLEGRNNEWVKKQKPGAR